MRGIFEQIDKPGYGLAKLGDERLAGMLARFTGKGLDVLYEAEKLRDWELFGAGEGKQTKDGVARFRSWLTKATEALPTTSDVIDAPRWLLPGETF